MMIQAFCWVNLSQFIGTTKQNGALFLFLLFVFYFLLFLFLAKLLNCEQCKQAPKLFLDI
jgi:hypothetical protein